MTFAIGCMTVEGRLDAFVQAVEADLADERTWRTKFDALRESVREIPAADALLDDLYDALVDGDWRDAHTAIEALRGAIRWPR